MPRPNGPRTVGGERNLAERMKRERESRRWSPADLARRMTEKGCSIATSAIYKIEDGDPPRKISVDELVALSVVFGTTVDDLLTPVEVLNSKRAEELLDQLTDADSRLVEFSVRYVGALAQLFDAGVFDRETHDYVQFRRERLGQRGADPEEPFGAGRYPWTKDPSGERIEVDASVMGHGLLAYVEVLTEQARLVATAKVTDDIESGWRIDHGDD